jgi:hypothetical protein
MAIIGELSGVLSKKGFQGFYKRRQAVRIEIPCRIFISECDGYPM